MSDQNTTIESNRQAIVESKQKGTIATLLTYTKLSGPGWLQSAITLGGGSLSGALYLGVIAGFSLLWVQALAMILGIVMLSAISWFTLSTGKRPFRAINDHINPVLGWSWAVATLMANVVWCMPQFALSTAAISQNLMPSLSAEGGPTDATKAVIVLVIFVICGSIIFFYDKGSKGVQVFEIILKIMVGIVVLSFFGTVVKMATSDQGLDWSSIWGGFIPNFNYFTQPSPTFAPFLEATGDFSQFWNDKIVKSQRDIMITAAATAVGINMTFLLPYSMLKKGWSKEFRGLAVFDLSTGLFIPYIVATTCVVICSASQFHGNVRSDMVENFGNKTYMGILESRILQEDPEALNDKNGQKLIGTGLAEKRLELAKSLPMADLEMGALLVKRDANNLAIALSPLTGEAFANKIFGIGVLGMGVSTIIILMLINGFTICEMLNIKPEGKPHLFGALLVGLVGMSGPFIWSKASTELAIPTSTFGFVLLPVAFITFALLVNHKGLMGNNRPKGAARLVWNILMGIAVAYATLGSVFKIWDQTKWNGILFVILLVIAGIIVHKVKPPKRVDQD